MLARRRLLQFVLAVLAAGVAMPAVPARSQSPTASVPPTMTAAEAHAKAVAGEVVLIDIRTPEEWRETGLPTTAHAINMYEDPKVFLARLATATGGDRNRHIALICRTGNRSNTLQGHLVRAGYTNVTDVSEGMAGGRHGKGWLKHGLPTRLGVMASTPPTVPAPASIPAGSTKAAAQ